MLKTSHAKNAAVLCTLLITTGHITKIVFFSRTAHCQYHQLLTWYHNILPVLSSFTVLRHHSSSSNYTAKLWTPCISTNHLGTQRHKWKKDSEFRPKMRPDLFTIELQRVNSAWILSEIYILIWNEGIIISVITVIYWMYTYVKLLNCWSLGGMTSQRALQILNH